MIFIILNAWQEKTCGEVERAGKVFCFPTRVLAIFYVLRPMCAALTSSFGTSFTDSSTSGSMYYFCLYQTVYFVDHRQWEDSVSHSTEQMLPQVSKDLHRFKHWLGKQRAPSLTFV